MGIFKKLEEFREFYIIGDVFDDVVKVDDMVCYSICSFLLMSWCVVYDESVNICL